MTFRQITGQLIAGSDLLFRSSRRRGNVLETLPYVPGSAIRGALAWRWITAHGTPDADFRRLFQSGAVRFGHGRPTVGGEEAFVAPLTLRKQKYPAEKTAPFIADVALDDPASAPDPKLRLDRFRGLVTASGMALPDEQMRTVVRTRIGSFSPDDYEDGGPDPSRQQGASQGLAAEGQLFTEVRLAEGTGFHVTIVGPEADLARLSEELPDGEDLLTIGRSRTIMGHVLATWSAPEEIPATALTGGPHTLTALSDLVLLDEFQHAHTLLDEVALARILGVDPAEVTIHGGGAVRTTRVGGWDGLNQMPTHIDTAIAAGSVVRFEAPQDKVEELAANPFVGWRLAEGHGRVAVDWPVHRLGRFTQVQEPSAVGPDGDPHLVDLAHGIAQDFVSPTQGERRAVTMSMWGQVIEAIRLDPTLASLRIREDTSSSHAQSASGRGARGASSIQRTREHVVAKLSTAFEGGPGGAAPLTQRQREVLTDHISRELKLLDIQRQHARSERQASRGLDTREESSL